MNFKAPLSMSRRNTRWLPLPLLLAVGACNSGQSPNEATAKVTAAIGTLSITGVITDAVSNPINGVKVQLAGSSSQVVYTDYLGRYTFSSLSSGSYSVGCRSWFFRVITQQRGVIGARHREYASGSGVRKGEGCVWR